MFRDQQILITGASSGLGAAMARCFARQGGRLILVARRRDRLSALAESLTGMGASVRIIAEDLGDPAAVDRIASQVHDAGLQVDVLVNNAGAGEYGDIVNHDPLALEQMLRVNILALVKLTQCFTPGMVARRCGRVLNVASTAAFQPTPYMGTYGASKSFVLDFSMSLWYELRTTGVSVTCLCPGPVHTEFFDRGGLEKQKAAFLKTAMPADRVAEIACRALAKGKTVYVPGTLNKICAFGYHISPLRLITRISGWLLRPVNA